MILGGHAHGASSNAVFVLTVNEDGTHGGAGTHGGWCSLPSMPVCREGGVAVALVPDLQKVVAALRTVTSLTDFPPGLLPLMASYLGAERVFIAGGLCGDNFQETVECYALISRTWETGLPAMHSSRHGGRRGQAIGNRRLMVFGNGDGRPPSSGELTPYRVISFDAYHKCWTTLPSMIFARPGCCSAEWQGRVFVFGGFYTDPEFSCECYDPISNRWSFIASMKRPCYDAVAVSVPGLGILVMGGLIVSELRQLLRRSSLSQLVELYDPRTNCWTTMAWTLPQPLYNFVAHHIAGRIIIIGGGCDDRVTCAECWSLDLTPDAPSWISLPLLPVPTSNMASVIVP